jgi:hypothetical protein
MTARVSRLQPGGPHNLPAASDALRADRAASPSGEAARHRLRVDVSEQPMESPTCGRRPKPRHSDDRGWIRAERTVLIGPAVPPDGACSCETTGWVRTPTPRRCSHAARLSPSGGNGAARDLRNRPLAVPGDVPTRDYWEQKSSARLPVGEALAAGWRLRLARRASSAEGMGTRAGRKGQVPGPAGRLGCRGAGPGARDDRERRRCRFRPGSRGAGPAAAGRTGGVGDLQVRGASGCLTPKAAWMQFRPAPSRLWSREGRAATRPLKLRASPGHL